VDYQEGNEMIKQNFNCNWLFSIGGNSLADPGRNQVVSVTVPHDAEIVRPRDPQAPGASSNGFFRSENCCYEKEFMLNTADSGKIVCLEFEGVYHNSFLFMLY
jgi:hypothetical protein